MKRVVAFLLAAVLALSLCACSKKESNELTGSWQNQWNVAEDLAVVVNFTVKDDSTFVLTVDAGDLINKIDEITAQLEAAGQNVSDGVDQVLGTMGVNITQLQTLLELLFPKKGDEGERKTTATIEGRCKTEDGKLYISLVKAVGLYGDSYLLYEVVDNALKLSLPEQASEITKMLGALLPITLQKVQ